MKVYVLYQDKALLGIVASKQGMQEGYRCEEFTVMGSPEQIEVSTAFNEVSKLSKEAQLQMGLTAEKMTVLEKRANADIYVNAGDTLYVDVFNGEDGRSPSRAEGVFSYQPKVDIMNRAEKYVVEESVGAFVESRKKKEINREIDGVSQKTKSFLDKFKL
jgi:hypothetical protein